MARLTPTRASAPVILRIDSEAAAPPYEQIRRQVVTAIISEELPEGSRLPPIRQLAGDLGVAAGTVARAYRELETYGVVVSRGRNGTFTRSPSSAPVPHDRDRQLLDAARTFALQARQLHVADDHAIDQVQRALEELRPSADH